MARPVYLATGFGGAGFGGSAVAAAALEAAGAVVSGAAEADATAETAGAGAGRAGAFHRRTPAGQPSRRMKRGRVSAPWATSPFAPRLPRRRLERRNYLPPTAARARASVGGISRAPQRFRLARALPERACPRAHPLHVSTFAINAPCTSDPRARRTERPAQAGTEARRPPAALQPFRRARGRRPR